MFNARGFTLSMPDLKKGFLCIRESDWAQLSSILTQYRLPEAVKAPEVAKDEELDTIRHKVAKKVKSNGATKKRTSAYEEFEP